MTTTYREEKSYYIKRIPIETTCDRCGAIIPKEGSYETREFDLKFNKGTSYPDGASGDVIEVEDLCDDCIEWLFQWLRDNRVKLNTYDY